MNHPKLSNRSYGLLYIDFLLYADGREQHDEDQEQVASNLRDIYKLIIRTAPAERKVVLKGFFHEVGIDPFAAAGQRLYEILDKIQGSPSISDEMIEMFLDECESILIPLA